jgi:7-cyano-7-deazaguanine synthase
MCGVNMHVECDSILLLSGGLDSSVLLGYILSLGKRCITLSFDYGQRHKIELDFAKKISEHYKVENHCLKIDPFLFSSAKSSLTDIAITMSIENTYVPARNLIFLSYAISFAESKEISEIYFGANSDDTHLFPDCRKEFFDALQITARLGTRTKNPLSILTPFSFLTKKEIISLGSKLAVPLESSFSCYNPLKGNTPCDVCQACILRNAEKDLPKITT